MTPATTKRRTQRIVTKDILLSGSALLLIAAAVGAERPLLILLLLLAVLGGAVLLRNAVPGGTLLSVTYCNIVVLYAAGFVVAHETLFRAASVPVLFVTFLLPLLGFFAGVVVRRRSIARQIARAHRTDEQVLLQGLRWLALYTALGLATLLMVDRVSHQTQIQDGILLAGAGLQALLTFVRVRQASQLLIESGVVFRAFGRRAAALIVPAFAFVTFYLFLVIVFAAVYALADRLTPEPSFIMFGEPKHLTFPEAVYFSVVTLSTIGYGDITPASGIARFLVVAEIVMGLLLLLFGFAEITRQMEARRQGARE